MALSGSIDLNMTGQALATFALKKIGVVGAVESPAAEDMADAITELGLMLKSWQMQGPNLWRQTFGSVALVASTASYTLTPRPFRLIEARYRNVSAHDIPMTELTRQEYVDLSNKSATGVPTQYYVDRQRTATTLYVWPVPSSVTTETVQYTYQRVIEDMDAQENDIDIPQEWFETVGYCLSDRLLDTYEIKKDNVRRRAAELLQNALDDDREAYIQFAPERR